MVKRRNHSADIRMTNDRVQEDPVLTQFCLVQCLQVCFVEVRQLLTLESDILHHACWCCPRRVSHCRRGCCCICHGRSCHSCHRCCHSGHWCRRARVVMVLVVIMMVLVVIMMMVAMVTMMCVAVVDGWCCIGRCRS